MAGEPLSTIVGNLVADPKPHISRSGKPWVTFWIASTPRVRDKRSGDRSDGEALWLGCRAYGEYADNIAASFTRGVIVQGRLTQRTYEQDGQKRVSLELEEIRPSLRFASTPITRKGTQSAQHGGLGVAEYPPRHQPGRVRPIGVILQPTRASAAASTSSHSDQQALQDRQ